MSKKKIVAGIGCGVLAAAAVTLVFVYTGTKGNAEALKDNQRYVYAYISDIEGNEITYTEMEESVVTAYLASRESETEDMEAEAAQETEENRDGRGDAMDREQPTGNAQGERTTGGPDGEMPTGEADGEMPTGGPDGEMPEKGAEMSAEMVTALIPVGITVHTADDTATTFQRLASGDMLKLLLETDADGEEVITEIWMLS